MSRHETGAQLARRLRGRWALVEVAATIVGALVVAGFLHALHSAEDAGHPADAVLDGMFTLGAYLALALPLGFAWRERRTRPLWRWLAEERAPTAAERDLLLREPLHEMASPAAMWGVALVAWSALEAIQSPHDAFHSSLTVALGGLTTCALIYLLVERLLRPVTARALAFGAPEQPVGPGVSARLMTAWAVASGIPLLGLALLAIGGLQGEFVEVESLAAAILVLSGAGLTAGSFAALLSARSLADPLTALRAAVARVKAGDLAARVAVDDASELGQLQAGFNEMATGLGERERLRDLFGRHVGEEVARKALAEGVVLGGEVREVAALFVDLVGSTALAAERPPEEVVARLNSFFAIVVEVVEAHGGWVNKFEGDAALCVFGAPAEQSDLAGEALAAARELGGRLVRDLPALPAGVGVSAGPAVAGHVGSRRRLEYTVVGDPVNEAARLCELSKTRPGRVLASAAAVERAGSSERARWLLGERLTLRGRRAPTRLAMPALGGARLRARTPRRARAGLPQ